MSRLRSCTMTDRTFILERKLQLCLCTKYSVCKTYTHCCLDICTLNRTIGLSLTAAATEHISEDIPKNIIHVTVFKMIFPISAVSVPAEIKASEAISTPRKSPCIFCRKAFLKCSESKLIV